MNTFTLIFLFNFIVYLNIFYFKQNRHLFQTVNVILKCSGNYNYSKSGFSLHFC